MYPDATTEVPGCEHGHCVFLWDRKQQVMESKWRKRRRRRSKRRQKGTKLEMTADLAGG